MDTRISGKTGLYAVIGKPISHTGSPVMYNFCFNHYGLDDVYLAFECDKDGVPATLAAFKQLGLKGGNVTMPCKQAVAKNVDKLSKAAYYTGAVNTIVNEDGVLTGHITDGEGVVLDLRDHGHEVAGKNVVLLGAGGAATAIFTQMALEGASSVTVFNRGEEGLNRVKSIAEKMSSEGVECKFNFYLTSVGDVEIARVVRGADILVNATSVGMSGVSEGQSVINDMSAFHERLVIYECIYNPAVTRLMADAAEHGVPEENIIGGRGMLLWQGSRAFKLFTGLDMPVKELKEFFGYL